MERTMPPMDSAKKLHIVVPCAPALAEGCLTDRKGCRVAAVASVQNKPSGCVYTILPCRQRG